MAQARHSSETAGTAVKETIESIVIAFVLAFVFRAYVVEAFVIPTGSMAPTLLGEHVVLSCEQCGYGFTVGLEQDDSLRVEQVVHPTGGVATVRRGYVTQESGALCPMCHYANRVARRTPISAGDRILVHKYIYSLTEPRRWDVVVFKNPQEPQVNYIKRLVGLPGESVLIADGNIFIRPPGAGEAEWHIARKSGRPEVQREVWQPVYHSRYVPLDGGEGRYDGRSGAWRLPWIAEGPGWQMEDRRSYRYEGEGPGSIRFDFNRALGGGPGWFPYNQRRQVSLPEPMEEMRIAASVQAEAPGLSVTLQTTARIDHRPRAPAPRVIRARIEPDGQAFLEALDDEGEIERLDHAAGEPFRVGVAQRVELWYVDQEASLWIDGRRVLSRAFDLPLTSVLARPPIGRHPRIALTVAGAPVTLHQVNVDRDLFYSEAHHGRESHMSGMPGTGVYSKADPSRSSPIHLRPDEFFCLGDNSTSSSDSRLWHTIDPWIERRMLAVEPGESRRLGVVPRDLMMGRAFFVYFPAPHGFGRTGRALIPNFGDMRFIH